MIRVLRILLLWAVVLATSPATAGEAEEVEAFNKAYLAYQKYQENGDYDLATAEAKTAYELGQRVFGKNNENTAALAKNYGRALIEIGSEKEAKRVFRETITLYEQVLGKDSEKLIPVLMDLGSSSAKVFEPRQQKKYYDRALKLAETHYGKDSEHYGLLSLNAGIGILDQSMSTDAKKYLVNAYRILRKTAGDENVGTGIAAFQLARFEIAKENYRKSEGYLLAAIKTFEDPERPASNLELSAHAWLVSAYENMGKSELATPHCLAIGRMTPAAEDQDYFPLYRKAPDYPNAALKQGREGYAIVDFTVDPQGFVQDLEVIEVDGHAKFAGASIEAVKGFRYAPRFIDGQAVATANVQTKMNFTMAK